MFNGKMKALTFSYDDGVMQDKKLIEILDRYDLKATFNINSELFGKANNIWRENKWIAHNRIGVEELYEVYKNHEVAVHTLTHPNLTELEAKEVVRQVEEDRKNLTKLINEEVVGMAYPCGGVNNNDAVAQIIQENTSIRYARTITSSYSFEPQKNLYRFNPTVYHIEFDKMLELGEAFIRLQADKPQIFYIWGHSYEFDYYDTWAEFEKFCKMISHRGDIFYGTNREILL